MTSRKLFSGKGGNELDSDDDIDLFVPVSSAQDIYIQNLVNSLNSGDPKERELSIISVINLSSNLEKKFVESIIKGEIIKILGERLLDPITSIALNTFEALGKLAKVSNTHDLTSMFQNQFEKNKLVDVMFAVKKTFHTELAVVYKQSSENEKPSTNTTAFNSLKGLFLLLGVLFENCDQKF